MNLTMRDRVATVLVATALLIYALRLGSFLGGLTSGAVAVVILALGILASASAVVPGFLALLHGSKTYLAITSVCGLVALGSGILTVVNTTEGTLAILMTMTLLLWAAASLRHANAHQRREVTAG